MGFIRKDDLDINEIVAKGALAKGKKSGRSASEIKKLEKHSRNASALKAAAENVLKSNKKK